MPLDMRDRAKKSRFNTKVISTIAAKVGVGVKTLETDKFKRLFGYISLWTSRNLHIGSQKERSSPIPLASFIFRRIYSNSDTDAFLTEVLCESCISATRYHRGTKG